jgi:cold shock CspA family protein
MIPFACVSKTSSHTPQKPHTKRLHKKNRMATSNFELESLVDHYICCVCLEPMQEAFTLTPCLHKLCDTCAQRCDVCPTCRQPILDKNKDHTFSGIVQEALLGRNYKCSVCGDVLGLPDTGAHRCLHLLVARFQGPFEALSSSLRELLIDHHAKGLPMDDDTLTTMLLTQQKIMLKALHFDRIRRLAGTVDVWSKGKGGEMCGFVKPADGSMSVFLHARAVVCGAAGVGRSVSFRAEPSAKGDGYRKAYDAVVLEVDEFHVGRVAKWQKDKRGKFYGFIAVDDPSKTSAYFTEDDVPPSIIPQMRPGIEAVLTVVNSPGRPDGFTARTLHFFSTRRATLSSPQLATAPPP